LLNSIFTMPALLSGTHLPYTGFFITLCWKQYLQAILICLALPSTNSFFVFGGFWGGGGVVRFELRAYTLSHTTSPLFCDGFFKIGSRELSPQAGFKP
jgi:hypothetical protein